MRKKATSSPKEIENKLKAAEERRNSLLASRSQRSREVGSGISSAAATPITPSASPAVKASMAAGRSPASSPGRGSPGTDFSAILKAQRQREAVAMAQQATAKLIGKDTTYLEEEQKYEEEEEEEEEEVEEKEEEKEEHEAESEETDENCSVADANDNVATAASADESAELIELSHAWVDGLLDNDRYRDERCSIVAPETANRLLLLPDLIELNAQSTLLSSRVTALDSRLYLVVLERLTTPPDAPHSSGGAARGRGSTAAPLVARTDSLLWKRWSSRSFVLQHWHSSSGAYTQEL